MHRKIKPRTYKQAAAALCRFIVRRKLKRVHEPCHMYEDKQGKICRVCLLGGINFAHHQGVLTAVERLVLTDRIHKMLAYKMDSVYWLNTVPRGQKGLLTAYKEAAAVDN